MEGAFEGVGPDWIPPELEEEDDGPEILLEAAKYWEAFLVLSSSRQVGFGLGPVQLSEIQAYLEIEQIEDPEERAQYVAFVGVCDREFLKIRAEQDEADRKARERRGKGR